MKHILVKEILINFSSGKLLTSVLLLLFTVLISLGMMFQEYRARLEHYEQSASVAEKDWLIETVWSWPLPNGAVNCEGIGTFPLGKVKRPQPLLFFARGVDIEFGKPVEYFTHFDHARVHVYPSSQQNLFKLVFDAPDLLAVVAILLSLLAMLFSSGLFCREKETGTLKLMLAAGASRTAIFTGKFLGGLLSMWLCYTGAFLVYLTVLAFLETQVLASEAAARVAAIYIAGFLFALVFYSLGALISAFSKSSATSVVLSFFLWLLLVFIAPSVVATLAQQLAPVPSRQEVERWKLDAMSSIQQAYAREHPDEQPSYRDGTLMFPATLGAVDEAQQKIEDEQERRILNREAITLNLARTSPVASVNNIISTLCRNGLEDLKRYNKDQHVLLQQLCRQLEAYNAYLWKTYPAWAAFGRTVEEQREIKRVFDIQTRFQYSVMDLAESLSFIWPDFALLCTYAVLVLASTFILFLRYDPR